MEISYGNHISLLTQKQLIKQQDNLQKFQESIKNKTLLIKEEYFMFANLKASSIDSYKK